MSHSMEVSLAVGGVVLAASGVSYRRFVRDSLLEPPPAAPPGGADGPTPLMLVPAFRSMVVAHVYIGLQQLATSAALWLESRLLYELGLLLSISCMLFALRSLEQLTRRSFGTPVVGAVVAAVGLPLFTREVTFEGTSFWVRGKDHQLWALSWVLLFLYWNVCLWSARKSACDRRDARLLRLYGWALLNFSFLFSMVYSFLAGLQAETGLATWFGDCLGVGQVSAGFRIVQDAPSIWSVFAGVQALVLPFLMRDMRAGYTQNLPPQPRTEPVLPKVLRVLLAGVLACALYGSFLVVRAVAEEMVTK